MKSPGVVREALTLKNMNRVQKRAPGIVLSMRHTFDIHFSMILTDSYHPHFMNEEKLGD